MPALTRLGDVALTEAPWLKTEASFLNALSKPRDSFTKLVSLTDLTQNYFGNLYNAFIVRPEHFKPKFLLVVPNFCNTSKRTKRILYYHLNFRICEHHSHPTISSRPN